MHESLPFFELKRCNETNLEQHKRNKTTFFLDDLIAFENYEIQNSSNELEDVGGIPKYDSTLRDTTDSNEN